MPIRFIDAGLVDVFLSNGYTVRDRNGGTSIRYERISLLLDALALALVRKPARLTSGEFRWLRRHIELSQDALGHLVDRDAQSISLVERGQTEVWALLDRELRRLAIQRVSGDPRATLSVEDLAARTIPPGHAKYFGTFVDGEWTFDVVAAQGPTLMFSATRTEGARASEGASIPYVAPSHYGTPTRGFSSTSTNRETEGAELDVPRAPAAWRNQSTIVTRQLGTPNHA